MNHTSIKSINTTPQSDPYHFDTGGVSYSTLKLYEDGEIVVCQEYYGDGIPADEWHDRTLTFRVPHCRESTMEAFLNDPEVKELLERVHFSHIVSWDGTNMVGKLLDDGYQAVQEFRQAIARDLHDEYDFWNANDWLGQNTPDEIGISANSTDEELAELAKEVELDARSGVHDGLTIILSDTEAYLVDLRNELRNAQEDD